MPQGHQTTIRWKQKVCGRESGEAIGRPVKVMQLHPRCEMRQE